MASGHATPDEEAEIRARAKDDPRLAMLLRAEQAIVVGLMADKASLPAGAVEPGAKLLGALSGSTGGVAGTVGGSMIVKGIIGGMVTIGIVAGLSLLPGTKENPGRTTPKPSTQERITPHVLTTPPVPESTSDEPGVPESAPTLADPGRKAPRVMDRPTTRGSEIRQTKSPRAKDASVRSHVEKPEGGSTNRPWKNATKRGEKTTNSTETSVRSK